MEIQAIEAFHNKNGKWVEIARWDITNAEYDAAGWLDKWADRIGSGQAPLPVRGRVDLSEFSVIRPVSDAIVD